jgi:glycosyltransferase involved in cell wall biosynthesis
VKGESSLRHDGEKLPTRGAWHLIASEYPPRTGGVSDYTSLVAEGLAAEGDEVHVWCPPPVVDDSFNVEDEPRGKGNEGSIGEAKSLRARVVVHREFGRFAPSDLRRVGRLLDECRAPRRLLVQYVPHGYGFGAMNVAFCAWLWKRARMNGDEVELMVHEPFLEFRGGTWRRYVVASAQRLMTVMLLRAAHRVRVAIPMWGELWRPYAFGRRVRFEWLPVPSTVPVESDPSDVAQIRARYVSRDGGSLVGHFGTYPSYVAEHLARLLPMLLARRESCAALLLGRGGAALRERILREHPTLATRLHAPGVLPARSLSSHLAACDILALPFPDGVSTRRTSAMAALAHGLAVVTTEGRLSEPLWAESRAVELVAAGDLDAMCEAIERLLADDAERVRLSASARALYLDRFDIARIISTLRRGVEEKHVTPDVIAAEVKA